MGVSDKRKDTTVMLRRWTDSIIFLALLGIDLASWALVSLIGGLDTSAPGRFASISLSSFIVVSAPVLATLVVLGIAPSLTWASPRLFYTWSAAAFLVGAVCSELFGALGRSQGMDVGLRWMACFCIVGAVASALALVVALVGAIPASREESQRAREAARSARAEKDAALPAEVTTPDAPLSTDEASPASASSSSLSPMIDEAADAEPSMSEPNSVGTEGDDRAETPLPQA